MQQLLSIKATDVGRHFKNTWTCFAYNLAVLTVYKVLLDFSYIYYVAPRWSYAGFLIGQLNAVSIAVSCAGLLIAAYVFTLTNGSDRFSSVPIRLLILMSFVPGLTLVQNVNPDFFPVFFAYWVMLILSYRCALSLPIRRFKLFNLEKCFSLLSMAIFLFVFLIWGVYANFHVQLDLINVYELRAEASHYAMPGFFFYISGAMQVCIPLLMVFGLKSKKYFSASLLFIAQIMVFFSTGSKSILASTVIAIFMYVVLSKLKCTTGTILLYSFIAIVVAAIVLSTMLNNSVIVDYFLRRNLFLTNLLSIDYYDFFSTNEPDYFRTSLLKYFGLPSPYAEESIPNMIARIYFNSPKMYSNNGLISDAVMNLGILGLGVMPLLMVVFLFVVDCCAGSLDRRLVVCSSVYFSFALIGSALFTSMLSHGFVVFALLLTGISEEGGNDAILEGDSK